MKKGKSIKALALAAMVAALYIAATGLFAPISFEAYRYAFPRRFALWHYSAPLMVPGLTVGCLLSNLFWSPFGILDITLGTLATFLGALGSLSLQRKTGCWRCVCRSSPMRF